MLTVKEVPYEVARDIIVKNHYSNKWNSAFGKVNLGIFQDGGDECLGVAVFGNLMNPTSFKSIAEGLDREGILELNRLWVDDCLVSNAESTFLSLCFKYIKKHYPHVELIQSFADGRLGCGTIYKAANFRYYGKSKTQFFEDVNDGIAHHRALFVDTRRLSSLAALNYRMALGEFKAFSVDTYRYIYPLNKKIIKRIKLKERPYPPYAKGSSYNIKFVQSLEVMSRAYMAFRIAGEEFDAEREVVYQYIVRHYGEHSVDQIRELSRSMTMDKFYEDECSTKQYLSKSLERVFR